MAMSLINRLFPREIMLIIFNNLSKEDQVTCLAVCKAWNAVSNDILGDLHIKIEPPKSCYDLWQDIVRYKTFGPGIVFLTVDNRRIQKDEATFIQIIDACPNLVQLKFTCEFRLYGYLKKLNHPVVCMPNIQRLHSINMEKGNPSLRKLYLWTNLKYRETLTSLSIWGLGANDTLDKHGGLIKFVSKFPKLNRLKVSLGEWVYYLDNVIEIDLAELTETSLALKTLEIHHYKISINPNQMSCSGTPKSRLEHLKLDVSSIDINCLSHIMGQLKGLKVLFLRANKSTGLLPSTTIVEEIFDQFNVYCKKLHDVYTFVKHQDLVFKLKQGDQKFNIDDMDTDGEYESEEKEALDEERAD